MYLRRFMFSFMTSLRYFLNASFDMIFKHFIIKIDYAKMY